MDKIHIIRRSIFILILPCFMFGISDYQCKKLDGKWYGQYSGYIKYTKSGDIVMAYTSLSLSIETAEKMVNECSMSYWESKYPEDNQTGDYWKNDMINIIKAGKEELNRFYKTKSKIEKVCK